MKELQDLLKKIKICKSLLDSLADACKSLNLDSKKHCMLPDAAKTVNALEMLLEVQISNLNKTTNPPTNPTNPPLQHMSSYVSHILSAQDLLFYLLDPSTSQMKILYDLNNNKANLAEIKVSADNYDTVFGVELDKHIWRAKYIQNASGVRLLDLGEELQEGKHTLVKYELPKNIQELPAQAQLCKLMGVEGQPAAQPADLQLLLKEALYQNIYLSIVKSEQGIHYVKFESSKAEKVPEHNENALPIYTLTQEVDNLDERWQQLEHGTDNAVEAVLGYLPKDAQRLCRFYDAKLGGCFKGAKCFKDHELSSQDAETKDCVPAALARDFNIKFEEQQILHVTLTHLVNLVSFYAQVNVKKDEPALVWRDDQIPLYKRFDWKQKQPGLQDLVLARYDDKCWYRARILEQHENSRYHVFYVDYGNSSTVGLDELAACFENVRQYPERARLMFLGGYEQNIKSRTQYYLLRQKFMNKLMNKSFQVRVLSHEMELQVEYVNEEQKKLFDDYVEYKIIRKITN